MKLLAQLITKLPRDAQNIVLNELYSQVADSDDVVRKPTLVSWLQSLSYLCTKATNQNAANQKMKKEIINLFGMRVSRYHVNHILRNIVTNP